MARLGTITESAAPLFTDAHNLVYEITSPALSWFHLDANTGTWTAAPPHDAELKVHNISIKATDMYGARNTTSFNLTVTNDAPVCKTPHFRFTVKMKETFDESIARSEFTDSTSLSFSFDSSVNNWLSISVSDS